MKEEGITTMAKFLIMNEFLKEGKKVLLNCDHVVTARESTNAQGTSMAISMVNGEVYIVSESLMDFFAFLSAD